VSLDRDLIVDTLRKVIDNSEFAFVGSGFLRPKIGQEAAAVDLLWVSRICRVFER
jgi:hypothetical protein